MIKIRLGGWAGQGTILAGVIIADALAMGQGYHVVQTRSYSAAVRSGISFSDVIADTEPMDELTIDTPDYLLIQYQKTLDTWTQVASECGCLIVDSTQVHDIPGGMEPVCVPASEIAERLGNTRTANMVLLGALSAVLNELDYVSLEDSVRRIVPSRYVEENLKALKAGRDLFIKGENGENLIIDTELA